MLTEAAQWIRLLASLVKSVSISFVIFFHCSSWSIFLTIILYSLCFVFQDAYVPFVTRRIFLFTSLFSSFDRMLLTNIFHSSFKKMNYGLPGHYHCWVRLRRFTFFRSLTHFTRILYCFSINLPKCWFLYCVSLLFRAVYYLKYR